MSDTQEISAVYAYIMYIHYMLGWILISRFQSGEASFQNCSSVVFGSREL